jgi:hypothetical protein
MWPNIERPYVTVSLKDENNVSKLYGSEKHVCMYVLQNFVSVLGIILFIWSLHSKLVKHVSKFEFHCIFNVDLRFYFSDIIISVAENRGEFLEKLQRARAQVKPNTPSQPILSRPGPARLVVGNWALASRKDGELHIHNSDGQQVKCYACVSFKLLFSNK